MSTHKPARPTGPALTSLAPDVAARLLNALLDSGKDHNLSQYAQARAFLQTIHFLDDYYWSSKVEKAGTGTFMSGNPDDSIHAEVSKLRRFFLQLSEVAGKEMSHE